MEGERPREPFIFASREIIGVDFGSAGGLALPPKQLFTGGANPPGEPSPFVPAKPTGYLRDFAR